MKRRYNRKKVRTEEEQKEFESLARLCGIHIWALKNRKRKGYRQRSPAGSW